MVDPHDDHTPTGDTPPTPPDAPHTPDEANSHAVPPAAEWARAEPPSWPEFAPDNSPPAPETLSPSEAFDLAPPPSDVWPVAGLTTGEAEYPAAEASSAPTPPPSEDAEDRPSFTTEQDQPGVFDAAPVDLSNFGGPASEPAPADAPPSDLSAYDATPPADEPSEPAGMPFDAPQMHESAGMPFDAPMMQESAAEEPPIPVDPPAYDATSEFNPQSLDAAPELNPQSHDAAPELNPPAYDAAPEFNPPAYNAAPEFTSPAYDAAPAHDQSSFGAAATNDTPEFDAPPAFEPAPAYDESNAFDAPAPAYDSASASDAPASTYDSAAESSSEPPAYEPAPAFDAVPSDQPGEPVDVLSDAPPLPEPVDAPPPVESSVDAGELPAFPGALPDPFAAGSPAPDAALPDPFAPAADLAPSDAAFGGFDSPSAEEPAAPLFDAAPVAHADDLSPADVPSAGDLPADQPFAAADATAGDFAGDVPASEPFADVAAGESPFDPAGGFLSDAPSDPVAESAADVPAGEAVDDVLLAEFPDADFPPAHVPSADPVAEDGGQRGGATPAAAFSSEADIDLGAMPDVPMAEPVSGIFGNIPMADPVSGIFGNIPMADPVSGIFRDVPTADPVAGGWGNPPAGDASGPSGPAGPATLDLMDPTDPLVPASGWFDSKMTGGGSMSGGGSMAGTHPAGLSRYDDDADSLFGSPTEAGPDGSDIFVSNRDRPKGAGHSDVLMATAFDDDPGEPLEEPPMARAEDDLPFGSPAAGSTFHEGGSDLLPVADEVPGGADDLFRDDDADIGFARPLGRTDTDASSILTGPSGLASAGESGMYLSDPDVEPTQALPSASDLLGPASAGSEAGLGSAVGGGSGPLTDPDASDAGRIELEPEYGDGGPSSSESLTASPSSIFAADQPPPQGGTGTTGSVDLASPPPSDLADAIDQTDYLRPPADPILGGDDDESFGTDRPRGPRPVFTRDDAGLISFDLPKGSYPDRTQANQEQASSAYEGSGAIDWSVPYGGPGASLASPDVFEPAPPPSSARFDDESDRTLAGDAFDSPAKPPSMGESWGEVVTTPAVTPSSDWDVQTGSSGRHVQPPSDWGAKAESGRHPQPPTGGKTGSGRHPQPPEPGKVGSGRHPQPLTPAAGWGGDDDQIDFPTMDDPTTAAEPLAWAEEDAPPAAAPRGRSGSRKPAQREPDAVEALLMGGEPAAVPSSTARRQPQRQEFTQEDIDAAKPKFSLGFVGGGLIGAMIGVGAFAVVSQLTKPPASPPVAAVQPGANGPGASSVGPAPGSVTIRHTDAPGLLANGDPVAAARAFDATPADAVTPDVRAGRGQAKLLARVRELAGTGKPVAADDAGLKAAADDLTAALEGGAQSPDAALRLGLVHELRGDLDAARKAYEDGAKKFPKSAVLFEAALDRLNATAPAKDGAERTSRLTPRDVLRQFVIESVVLLAAQDAPAPAAQDTPAPEAAAADDDTEAGVYFWKAVRLAEAGKYAEAEEQIGKAKAAHEKRKLRAIGRGLNPLSDPLEQIFPKACDDLKAYWTLRRTVYEHPGVGPMAKADGLAKTLDSAATAMKTAADAQAAVEKLKALKLDDKSLADAVDTLAKTVETERKTVAEAMAKAEKELKAYQTEVADTKKAKDEAETKLADATKQLTDAEARFAGVAKELRDAKLLGDAADPAAVMAAVKEAAVRASGPNLGTLLPSGTAAVGGVGLSSAQLLDLAGRATKANAELKQARDTLAVETKRLNDAMTAEREKLATAAAAEREKMSAASAEEVKKARDAAAAQVEKAVADARKARDDAAAAVKTAEAKAAAESQATKEQAAADVRKARDEMGAAQARYESALRDQEMKFRAQMGVVRPVARSLDLWLPLLAEGRRAADADPAAADAAVVLATAPVESEDRAKALAVRGMAQVVKGDRAAGLADLRAAQRSPGYAAGRPWAKVVEDAIDAATDPTATARRAEPAAGKRDAESAVRHFAVGVVAYRTGRFAEAEEAFKQAVFHDAADARYWYFLGAARWQGGRTTEAAGDFRQGADREARQQPARREVNRVLEVVQGPVRAALEVARP